MLKGEGEEAATAAAEAVAGNYFAMIEYNTAASCAAEILKGVGNVERGVSGGNSLEVEAKQCHAGTRKGDRTGPSEAVKSARTVKFRGKATVLFIFVCGPRKRTS